MKGQTDQDFLKVISFFRYRLLKSLQKAAINRIEKGILVNFLEILFESSLPPALQNSVNLTAET